MNNRYNGSCHARHSSPLDDYRPLYRDVDAVGSTDEIVPLMSVPLTSSWRARDEEEEAEYADNHSAYGLSFRPWPSSEKNYEQMPIEVIMWDEDYMDDNFEHDL